MQVDNLLEPIEISKDRIAFFTYHFKKAILGIKRRVRTTP